MIYVLCFSPAYQHARHYVGFTDNVDRRIARHLAGRGSPLVRAAVQAGCTVSLTLVVEGDRTDERRIKNRANGCEICPVCRAEFLARKREATRRRRLNKTSKVSSKLLRAA